MELTALTEQSESGVIAQPLISMRAGQDRLSNADTFHNELLRKSY